MTKGHYIKLPSITGDKLIEYKIIRAKLISKKGNKYYYDLKLKIIEKS
jgi:hypothetical protein